MPKTKSISSKETLFKTIYDHIVAGIISGDYPPKSKLTQMRIAEKLNISHVPVREAMDRLHSHGWIERIPMKGAYVKQFNEKEIIEIYQTRELFETFAARITTENITSEQRAKLNDVIKLLDTSLNAGDREAYSEADIEFHQLIVHFAGNRRIAEMHEAVLLQTHCFFEVIAGRTIFKIRTAGESEGTEQHRQMYEAIANHDIEKAVYWTTEHIKLSYNSITAIQKILSRS